MAASTRTCVDVVLLRHGLVVRDGGGGVGSGRPTYVAVGDARRVFRASDDAIPRQGCVGSRGMSHTSWFVLPSSMENVRKGKQGPSEVDVHRSCRSSSWDVSTPSSSVVCLISNPSAPHVAELRIGYEAWMARRRRHPSEDGKKGKKERKERGRWIRGTTTCRVQVEIQPPRVQTHGRESSAPGAREVQGGECPRTRNVKVCMASPTCFLD